MNASAAADDGDGGDVGSAADELLDDELLDDDRAFGAEKYASAFCSSSESAVVRRARRIASESLVKLKSTSKAATTCAIACASSDSTVMRNDCRRDPQLVVKLLLVSCALMLPRPTPPPQARRTCNCKLPLPPPLPLPICMVKTCLMHF